MKITCDIISDLLPSYIDSICTEDSKRLVETHLRACDSCRENLREMEDPTEVFEQPVKKAAQDPFKKIRKMNQLRVIFAVLLTSCIFISCMFAVQEIGVLHDAVFPIKHVRIENETMEDEWIQVTFEDSEYLNFSTIFYKKEVVNATDGCPVTIRILDRDRNIVLDEMVVEERCRQKLRKLRRHQDYIVEMKGSEELYFLNFL